MHVYNMLTCMYVHTHTHTHTYIHTHMRAHTHTQSHFTINTQVRKSPIYPISNHTHIRIRMYTHTHTHTHTRQTPSVLQYLFCACKKLKVHLRHTCVALSNLSCKSRTTLSLPTCLVASSWYVCVYVCMYVCMYVCVCVCVCHASLVLFCPCPRAW